MNSICCPTCGRPYAKHTAGLTPKQRELLDFVRNYISEHGGVSPSHDEMKAAMGLQSKSGITRLIGALEERGFVHRMPNRARTLTVIGAAA